MKKLISLMELSDDMWNVIFSYLDVTARANIASVNKRLSSLFSTWIDITMLSIKQDNLCIAGDNFKCITKCDLKLVLQHCPNLNNINIQAIRDENYLKQLSKIEHLSVLTIASSAFKYRDKVITTHDNFRFVINLINHLSQINRYRTNSLTIVKIFYFS
ncbi:unnamed protein product [Brugia timori]|uniref:F-box domain-containing protein n=1 Tax=Brugia timori TaxID=42155 RepID=A0A0R3Q5J3_9BILA|nr:unnamed protein product [Brugia timori]